REHAAVVVGIEVLEAVHPAPREEGLVGGGGIRAGESLGQEGLEIQRRRLAQRLGGPAGYGIARLRGPPALSVRVETREFLMQARHDLEVVREGAELGRAAQLELHP